VSGASFENPAVHSNSSHPRSLVPTCGSSESGFLRVSPQRYRNLRLEGEAGNRNMDQRYMVKRYLARLHSRSGRVFDVFSTGLPGWLLFCAIRGADTWGNGGYQTGLQIPVWRAALRGEIRRAIPQG
jgi:hypothetical protein